MRMRKSSGDCRGEGTLSPRSRDWWSGAGAGTAAPDAWQ